MEKNNLEKNIKDSFEQYMPNLNNDEIWDNIEPHLKKKKKRRFFFIWFFGGLALLGLFLLNQFHWNKESIKSNIDSKDEVIASTLIEPSETVLKYEENELSIDSVTKNKLSNTDKESVSKKSESYNLLPKKKSAKLLKKKRSVMNLDVDSEFPTIKTPKEINPPSKANPFKEVVEENLETEVSIESPDKTQTKTENKDSKPNTSKTKITDPIESAVAKTKRSREEAIAAADKKRKKEYFEKNPTKKVSRRSRRKVKYFVQPTVSGIIPIRILKEKPGSEQKEYLNLRKDTEQQLEAFAFGLNLIAQTRRGLIISTGIEVQRLNSRYSFYETTEELKEINGPITVTENALGQIIESTTGSKSAILKTEKTLRIYNNHTFINLPIGFGKHWSNRKYDFQLLSGLNFNLHHSFNGMITGPQRDLDMRSKRNRVFEKTFKRKAGIDFWLSSSFQKEINTNMSLCLEPRIQIPFNSISTEEYVLDQRFIKFSITFGAKFSLIPETISKPKK